MALVQVAAQVGDAHHTARLPALAYTQGHVGTPGMAVVKNEIINRFFLGVFLWLFDRECRHFFLFFVFVFLIFLRGGGWTAVAH